MESVNSMYGYIYLIVNNVNGKTYVGQRKTTKSCSSDKYMGSGKHLKCAQKKYGIENFEKFLIQYCNSKEELDKQEVFWITEYRSRGKAEYNICAGGRGGCAIGKEHYNYGKHLSEEARRKMSEAHSGKEPWNKGLKTGHRSEETKIQMSEAQRRRRINERK